MEEEYVKKAFERIDDRGLEEFRPIEIKEGVVHKAEGSAMVRLGKTEVIAGVKMEVGTPFPDTPDEGILIVNSEFSPIASPEFEPGRPGEDSIELSRVVDRGIRESKAIELEKLCLVPGEKVWSVFVDIHIINHQGNLLDCSALASIVALLNTQIPKMEGDKIIRGVFDRKLPMIWKPINITVGKISNDYILDPTLEEDKLLESKLSICVRDDDKICSLQKQGSKEMDIEDIKRMIDLAIEKSKEIRKMVK